MDVTPRAAVRVSFLIVATLLLAGLAVLAVAPGAVAATSVSISGGPDLPCDGSVADDRAGIYDLNMTRDLRWNALTSDIRFSVTAAADTKIVDTRAYLTVRIPDNRTFGASGVVVSGAWLNLSVPVVTTGTGANPFSGTTNTADATAHTLQLHGLLVGVNQTSPDQTSALCGHPGRPISSRNLNLTAALNETALASFEYDQDRLQGSVGSSVGWMSFTGSAFTESLRANITNATIPDPNETGAAGPVRGLFGWYLRYADGDLESDVGINISSTNATDETLRPNLTIQYTFKPIFFYHQGVRVQVLSQCAHPAGVCGGTNPPTWCELSFVPSGAGNDSDSTPDPVVITGAHNPNSTMNLNVTTKIAWTLGDTLNVTLLTRNASTGAVLGRTPMTLDSTTVLDHVDGSPSRLLGRHGVFFVNRTADSWFGDATNPANRLEAWNDRSGTFSNEFDFVVEAVGADPLTRNWSSDVTNWSQTGNPKVVSSPRLRIDDVFCIGIDTPGTQVGVANGQTPSTGCPSTTPTVTMPTVENVNGGSSVSLRVNVTNLGNLSDQVSVTIERLRVAHDRDPWTVRLIPPVGQPLSLTTTPQRVETEILSGGNASFFVNVDVPEEALADGSERFEVVFRSLNSRLPAGDTTPTARLRIDVATGPTLLLFDSEGGRQAFVISPAAASMSGRDNFVASTNVTVSGVTATGIRASNVEEPEARKVRLSIVDPRTDRILSAPPVGSGSGCVDHPGAAVSTPNATCEMQVRFDRGPGSLMVSTQGTPIRYTGTTSAAFT
ncbi:MAG: hypothetical protein ACT4PT_04905, partial [Methanobacteriota archaeon]